MIKFQNPVMNRITDRLKKPILVIIFLFSQVISSAAQLSPGQYLEEAPLGTWNIFGLDTAASLAAGFSQIVSSRSNSIALTNPAFLALSPQSNLSLNLSFNQAQLFKYWLVNTGVLSSTGNLYCRLWQINYLGLSLRWRQWAFTLVYARNENYDRPDIDYQSLSDGVMDNTISLRQTGSQTLFGLAVSRKLNSRLSAGLSLVKIKGSVERKLEETWPLDEIQMLDDRSQKISGFYTVFGLFCRITDRLSLGLSFIPPYHKKAKSQSLLAYISPQGDTGIEIYGEEVDRIKTPVVFGLGSRFLLRSNLEIHVEAVYFNWKRYSYTYFAEEMARPFRQILRISSGLEYRSRFRLFGKEFISPYYLGVLIDPQPMTDISSTYYYLTFGSGLSSDSFSLTFGTAIGFERGSGQKLKNQKVSITLDFYPDLKRIIRGERNDKS